MTEIFKAISNKLLSEKDRFLIASKNHITIVVFLVLRYVAGVPNCGSSKFRKIIQYIYFYCRVVRDGMGR